MSSPQANTHTLEPARERSTLRVAILDRDTGFVVVLLNRLQQEGWESSVLPTDTSTERLAGMDIDVLIVDLAAVTGKRWKWLGEICRSRPDLSIVVCSRSSSVSQRVVSLRLGVDDWLTKPCHPEELVARIGAVTGHTRRRRTRSLAPVVVGELEIRPDQYQAFVRGASVQLTLREYHLLELLARDVGEIQSRVRIYETLWGREMERNERSVDVCIHKVRRKLEVASPAWRYIHTHYGHGYRLAAKAVGDRRLLELPVPEEPTETSLAA